MKVAMSYSLFGDPLSFEFGFYLRGCYLNARMNEILFPTFDTDIHISDELHQMYSAFWSDLTAINYHVHAFEVRYHEQRCKSMMWRFYPIWNREPKTTHVICRDTDSVSTYREACCVYDWIDSGLPYHAINDNAAHSGLMGGLVAFRSEDFKTDTGYKSFSEMVEGLDLKQHGSDQNFMNKFIHPKIKHKLLLHNLKGNGCEAAVTKTEVPQNRLDKNLWLTDLISRYIGSAGVIDFELLRFLRSRHEQTKYNDFEKKYSQILYWAR